MDRIRESSRYIRERVGCIRYRRRARCPQVCQGEKLCIAARERETVERVRKSSGAVHHRRCRRVRHGR